MKKRATLQVDPQFVLLIKDIQRDLMNIEGRFVSTREITQRIRREDISKLVLKNTDLNLRSDGRRR